MLLYLNQSKSLEILDLNKCDFEKMCIGKLLIVLKNCINLRILKIKEILKQFNEELWELLLDLVRTIPIESIHG